MNDRHLVAGEQRLEGYVSQLADVLGHADRKERLVGDTVNLSAEDGERWVPPALRGSLGTADLSPDRQGSPPGSSYWHAP